MRHVVAVIAILCLSAPAYAAKLKPIHLHPEYDHDKFVTKPADIVRKFRAYTTSFDSADDDNGDGAEDRWGIPHWVAYQIMKRKSNPSKNDPCFIASSFLGW